VTDPTSEPGRMDLWVEERHRDIFAARYRVKRVLFSDRSPYQQVEILETEGMGKMLLNDGLVMISERDEFVYHEMIAHVPLFTHPKPERVLIIGGGDGGAAREVLRHPGVKKCHMVEIDEMVVSACREFIPHTASCLDDPRLSLVIADGVKFVGETEERFDVVLVDSTDPIGPAKPLFGRGFYSDVRRILTDGGMVVSQGESPFYETEAQKSLLGILGSLFPHTHIYNFTNLTYPGGLWSFTYASRGICPQEDFDPTRVLESGMEFRYYNPAVHLAAFALPGFMLDDVGDLLKGH
jgi:spermidine synthase